MNEIQIEYFLAVAENQSFTKTANELYVSQPAVSKQISQLEEELGVTLFYRGRKTTQITEAGILFLNYFKKRNTELKNIINLAQNYQSNGNIPLRIATGSSWTLEEVLSPFIPIIKKSFPDASITVANFSFEELGEMLLDGRADVIIGMAHSIRPNPSIEIRNLSKNPRYIAYSDKLPISSKKNLTAYDLKDEIFFFPAMTEKAFVKSLIASCIKPYGFVPKVQSVPNDQSMISCVINGFGVAMVDSWMISALETHLKYLKVNSFFDISIAWKKETANPVLDLFISTIMANSESKAPEL